MISISTKLTLLILALPISVLLLLDLAIFYYYKTSIEVSALLSAILVFLLVWERLRDSLSKKLEYLHKNYVFKLYSAFRYDHTLFFKQDEIKRIRDDLGKYGRFMILLLYPRDLLKKVDVFLSLHGEFYGRLGKIRKLVEEQNEKSQWYMDAIWDYTGLEPVQRSRHTSEEEEWLRGLAQFIVKEHPQLISETKELLEKTKRMRRQIFDKLEDFLKSNNLRLEAKPAYREYDL